MQKFEIWASDPGADGDHPHVVGVVGEVDLVTAEVVRAALLQALAHADQDVEVDLSRVEFMDAAGVSALVEAWSRAVVSGHKLVVRRPSDAVRRVMQLCGLDGQFFPSHNGSAA